MMLRRISVLVLVAAAAMLPACKFAPQIDANGFECKASGDCPPDYQCAKPATSTVGVCCNKLDPMACLAPPEPGPDSGSPDISPDVATAPDAPVVTGIDSSVPNVAVLAVDRPTVNLGTLDVGRTGVGTVKVTNTGNAVSGALTVTASASMTATGCSGAMAAGEFCTLTISATPTVAGAFSGTVSISANPGAVPPLVVSVIATGSAAGLFSVSPQILDFGNVAVGATTSKITITVTAAGTLSDLTVSPSGAEVSLDATSTCASYLAAGSSCSVGVNFKATTPGTKSDSIVISAGGASGKSVTVPVAANALTPAKLVITPSTPQTFATSVGQTSSAVIFNVANSGDMGTGALTVAIAGANASSFAASSTCTVLASLAGCTVSVVFKPPVASTTNETATLTVTDTGPAASTVSVGLTGIAYSLPNPTITPTTSDLGSVLVGTTGASTTFTVTNSGDTSTGPLTATVSSAEFVITNDTCTGISLPKAASCAVSIALRPATIGAKNATLTISGPSGNPAVKTLTGTGISTATLTATPAAIDWGSVTVNRTGTAQTVTVRNLGGAATGALSFTKTGNFSEFPITANTCSAALAPAATCIFTVNFAPIVAGSEVATYTITDGSIAATIAASGIGLAPAGIGITPSPAGACSAAAPTSPCFDDTIVGGTSSAITFTVTADSIPSGVADTGAITAALTGTNASDFTIMANTCTVPLLANATCTISVTFAPTAAGTRQASLAVTSAKGGATSASLTAKAL